MVVEVEVEAAVGRTRGDLTRVGMMAMIQLEVEDRIEEAEEAEEVVEEEADDQDLVSMVEGDEKAEAGPTCLLRWPGSTVLDCWKTPSQLRT